MGYSLILKIKRLEEELHNLGMRWGYDKHGRWGEPEQGDTVAVYPRDDQLPVYNRDAMLFHGSINQLESWLHGIKWARDYDMLLRLGDEKKRKKSEDAERERQRVRAIKEDQKRVWKILKDEVPEDTNPR